MDWKSNLRYPLVVVGVVIAVGVAALAIYDATSTPPATRQTVGAGSTATAQVTIDQDLSKKIGTAVADSKIPTAIGAVGNTVATITEKLNALIDVVAGLKGRVDVIDKRTISEQTVRDIIDKKMESLKTKEPQPLKDVPTSRNEGPANATPGPRQAAA